MIKNNLNYATSKFSLPILPDLESLPLEEGKYKLISMWHVLEHIYSLNEHLSKIHRLLSQSGILIVAVPNPESYDAKHYDKFWAAYDLPRHLYHFTQKSIRQLFEKHNFELVSTHPMKFDSYYVSMLSEKYKSGKSNYLKAFWNGFISNFKAVGKNQNYSSLIYIFKAKIG